jgi:hypothetical protein
MLCCTCTPRELTPKAASRLTDEVCQPERSHGLVGTQPHAFVNVLSRAHPLDRSAASLNTIQYNTIQYNTIQYNTIRYNTIQY